MYKFDFSYNEYQELIRKCAFNDEELKIIEYKRKNESNIYICNKLNISTATLTRRIKRIANKIKKNI